MKRRINVWKRLFLPFSLHFVQKEACKSYNTYKSYDTYKTYNAYVLQILPSTAKIWRTHSFIVCGSRIRRRTQSGHSRSKLIVASSQQACAKKKQEFTCFSLWSTHMSEMNKALWLWVQQHFYILGLCFNCFTSHSCFASCCSVETGLSRSSTLSCWIWQCWVCNQIVSSQLWANVLQLMLQYAPDVITYCHTDADGNRLWAIKKTVFKQRWYLKVIFWSLCPG